MTIKYEARGGKGREVTSFDVEPRWFHTSSAGVTPAPGVKRIAKCRGRHFARVLGGKQSGEIDELRGGRSRAIEFAILMRVYTVTLKILLTRRSATPQSITGSLKASTPPI
jgi:hypothetical protein